MAVFTDHVSKEVINKLCNTDIVVFICFLLFLIDKREILGGMSNVMLYSTMTCKIHVTIDLGTVFLPSSAIAHLGSYISWVI